MASAALPLPLPLSTNRPLARRPADSSASAAPGRRATARPRTLTPAGPALPLRWHRPRRVARRSAETPPRDVALKVPRPPARPSILAPYLSPHFPAPLPWLGSYLGTLAPPRCAGMRAFCVAPDWVRMR